MQIPTKTCRKSSCQEYSLNLPFFRSFRDIFHVRRSLKSKGTKTVWKKEAPRILQQATLGVFQTTGTLLTSGKHYKESRTILTLSNQSSKRPSHDSLSATSVIGLSHRHDGAGAVVEDERLNADLLLDFHNSCVLFLLYGEFRR